LPVVHQWRHQLDARLLRQAAATLPVDIEGDGGVTLPGEIDGDRPCLIDRPGPRVEHQDGGSCVRGTGVAGDECLEHAVAVGVIEKRSCMSCGRGVYGCGWPWCPPRSG